MFVGQYEHSLDAKGRVVLPATYRAELPGRCFITKLADCLGLWGEDDFNDLVATLREDVKNGLVKQSALRKLMMDVSEVRLDSAGRITIPRKLLDSAGLTDQVFITGLDRRVEIWSPEAFAALDSDAEAEQAIRDAVEMGRL